MGCEIALKQGQPMDARVVVQGCPFDTEITGSPSPSGTSEINPEIPIPPKIGRSQLLHVFASCPCSLLPRLALLTFAQLCCFFHSFGHNYRDPHPHRSLLLRDAFAGLNFLVAEARLGSPIRTPKTTLRVDSASNVAARTGRALLFHDLTVSSRPLMRPS